MFLPGKDLNDKSFLVGVADTEEELNEGVVKITGKNIGEPLFEVCFETSKGIVCGNVIVQNSGAAYVNYGSKRGVFVKHTATYTVKLDEANLNLLSKLYVLHRDAILLDMESGWVYINLDDGYYGSPEYKFSKL